ncbi:MAG: hypothetical protein KAQ98_09030 [Bacteriovoracaceae bacterium]|nr:hypothetical protein [Bacteriovoracaceae bacterium]
MPVSIRELIYLNRSPCDLYTINKNIFDIHIKKKSQLGKDILRDLVAKKTTTLYAKENDHKKIVETQQNLLRNSTRSISIGNPLENAKKQLNFLTLNMYYLYQNVTDNELLNLQIQSINILSQFLLDNIHIHKPLFDEYQKQKHHHIFSQPLLSSLFLLGVLKQSHMYADKNIEQLFLTSYLKDIGMSAIPTDRYDKEELSEKEKKLLLKHARISVEILIGRTPLKPNHLRIIEYHHAFSHLRTQINSEAKNVFEDDNEMLLGFETLAISITDIISAMISERPYRNSTTLFQSLEFIKYIIADQFPKEFKLFVTFFKQFYS